MSLSINPYAPSNKRKILTMKIKPSHFVLIAEIFTIILFHVVKFKHTAGRPADIAYSPTVKSVNLHKPNVENKTGLLHMLLELGK